MILLIIRHGESEADILHVHEGRADYDLTSRGHRQAEAMAEYVRRNYTVDKLYSSTLKRAASTAAHLSDALGVDICFDENLMEFNNGLIAGLPYDEAAIKYPRIMNLPVDQSVYGQESLTEFRERAVQVLVRIGKECENKNTVAVVTHGGLINQLYGAALKMRVGADIHFPTGDTGIHIWEINDDGIRIITSNLTVHADGI